ncbi:ABC transporter substrate-binding protein [Nocardia sp. N13]|uniref:ABC transporter substrate-binding protein n=1 Tax=Nocardioides sp. N13(2025) TaxID=3453405 RepID=UPI003F771B4A
MRDDVTFHDGEPFNAEAVCYNFERMFDQNEAGQTAGEYWGYVMGAFSNDAENSLYQGCEATDEFEAVISISGPTSGFPTMLTLESLSMQSPKALEEGDANGIAAEGEGFSLPGLRRQPGRHRSLHVRRVRRGQRRDHPRPQRRLLGREGQDERASSSASSRRRPPVVRRLEAGSINGYDLPNPVDWAGLEEDGNSVEVRDPFNILYLGFNLEGNPLLKDLKVRQALYHALNREQARPDPGPRAQRSRRSSCPTR